jgi:hypothetical protein
MPVERVGACGAEALDRAACMQRLRRYAPTARSGLRFQASGSQPGSRGMHATIPPLRSDRAIRATH